jgi:mannose-6-phosphate isomerase-like protein (cupin superfamily)
MGMAKKPIFSKVEQHDKAWGRELWMANNEKYCGKILEFNQGSSFSMHYHIKKEETWMVVQGVFEMEYFDLNSADISKTILNVGDTVHLEPSIPHKLTCVECESGKGMIFEVSTQHFNEDSYRIGKGDSQK